TEQFEIGEGGKKEEARFRPLLALEGSVTKFGATTMDGAAVSALSGKGASPKVNYVATDRDGRSVLTKTLPVKDAPGDILAGSVATQTDTAAPWTVTNTSRNSVRFVYRVPAPLRAVDGPGEGNFVLAPGETRTVCSITSAASGTYPIEYAQAALVPAAPDLLAAEAPEELIWQGGPAQGPVVFDAGAGAAGELVEGSRRLPLELSGYTASPLKTAELNDAPASVATGDKSSVGGFGEMAPFAIGGLGALLAVGPNLLKGKTQGGEEVETLFTAVPAELPVAALANTKRADGVVAVAVESCDLGRVVGISVPPQDIYSSPETTGKWLGKKRYSGGDLTIEGVCKDVLSAHITFVLLSGTEVCHAIPAKLVGVASKGKKQGYTYTIPEQAIPQPVGSGGIFTLAVKTTCATVSRKVEQETFADDRPPSGGSPWGGSPSGGKPADEPEPPTTEPQEVINIGNATNVSGGDATTGGVAGGGGAPGGATGLSVGARPAGGFCPASDAGTGG
ncbi:MAG: hypothetical protein RDV41_15970, partial [Planctomycetota bacterium]|nr:hypothetical protein [Planctomycetota bacterium]